MIDGDTLTALAGSSREIRASVLMSHRAVVGLTLRCRDEGVSEYTAIPYPDFGDETDRRAYKMAPCVRDVVAPCRRCNVVICRASIYSCFFFCSVFPFTCGEMPQPASSSLSPLLY